jgi:hypothetical protein
MTGHIQVIIESILAHVVNSFWKVPARGFDKIVSSTFKSLGLKLIPYSIRNVAKANRLLHFPGGCMQPHPDIDSTEMRVRAR